jgi:hypothetical protein
MRRVAQVAILAVALMVPAFGSMSASAAVPATTAPSCGKLTGTISTTFSVSRCTPASRKYKSASAKSSSLATGKGTLTWSRSKKTTKVTISISQSGTSCAVGSTEYKVKGSVTGGTATFTKRRQAVSADVCVSATGDLSLVPKTRMAL